MGNLSEIQAKHCSLWFNLLNVKIQFLKVKKRNWTLWCSKFHKYRILYVKNLIFKGKIEQNNLD